MSDFEYDISRTPECREEERQELNKNVEDFLQNGGTIQTVPMDVSNYNPVTYGRNYDFKYNI